MTRGITLTTSWSSGLSVSFTSFMDQKGFIRSGEELGDQDRTAEGNAITYGRNYALPNRWQFNAVVSPTEWDICEAIFEDWDTRRRVPANDVKLIVIDTTREIKEKSPRTRAVAPSPYSTVRAFGPSSAWVAYCAQYYASWTQRPEAVDIVTSQAIGGTALIVNIALIDTSQKVAP